MPYLKNPFFRAMAALSLAMATFASLAHAQTGETAHSEAGAALLHQKHADLAGRLASKLYKRPLVIDSNEGANTVTGDVYAVLDAPFRAVSATFTSPRQWCEVLLLHLNTKYCHAPSESAPISLDLVIGRKHPQALKDAMSLQFNYKMAASTPRYFAAELTANNGPVGTSDYRITLKAIPLGEGKTFMHLRYSYDYGLVSKLAMQAYLATLGSEKVGFTQTGQPPLYVGGVRGAVERNTMRYYLAMEAYLASLDKPDAQQLDARLDYWFSATEEYALQLHEIDRDGYLSMKKQEYQRQRAAL